MLISLPQYDAALAAVGAAQRQLADARMSALTTPSRFPDRGQPHPMARAAELTDGATQHLAWALGLEPAFADATRAAVMSSLHDAITGAQLLADWATDHAEPTARIVAALDSAIASTAIAHQAIRTARAAHLPVPRP